MAQTIIRRIKFQVGHAVFDIDTDNPIITIKGKSGTGKTFLWKSIRDKAERGEEGYERFICLSYRTDTLRSFYRQIRQNSGKIFVIEDLTKYSKVPQEIAINYWRMIGSALYMSANQYIFIGAELVLGGCGQETAYIEIEGNTIEARIFRIGDYM